jgi:membrane protease YdiL (CAAX protease family)
MLPVAVIVAIEEIVWRGFLQPQITLIPAAVAFALHHYFFGWRHVLFAFLAGIAWGLLFWASGSLWPPIASHLAYNILAWREMRRRHFSRNPAPPVSS